MSTKSATHLAACAAIIAFSIALVLPAFVAIPVLWYRPVEHAWSFASHTSGIAMDFYGRCAFAALVAALVAVASFRIARSRRRELSRDVAAMVGIWAIAILAMAFFTWRQLHRTLAAAPAPPIPLAIADD